MERSGEKWNRNQEYATLTVSMARLPTVAIILRLSLGPFNKFRAALSLSKGGKLGIAQDEIAIATYNRMYA